MRAWLALLLAGCAVACSKAAPKVGPTSGVDPGDADAPRYLTDLTLTERKKLCDWTAEIGGGYGTSVQCDSGLFVSNFTDQQACLDSFLGACYLTITDWEACRDKEVSDPCAGYLYTSDECANVRRCLGETDGGPQPEPEGGPDAEGGT
jgi:hypothetical protein